MVWLWIAFGALTVFVLVNLLLLWLYVAAVSTVVNSHQRDNNRHWISDFDDDPAYWLSQQPEVPDA